jgi:hypothetical protein
MGRESAVGELKHGETVSGGRMEILRGLGLRMGILHQIWRRRRAL